MLADGRIRGASFAAYHDGRLVVNLIGGVADLGAARPWTPDTLTATMSVSKAVAGLCVALLVHRCAARRLFTSFLFSLTNLILVSLTYSYTVRIYTDIVITECTCRGLLKYEDPVAKHWPEFAQSGKARVSIDMLVSHRVCASLSIEYEYV